MNWLQEEYKKTKFKVPDGVRISGDCVFSPNEGFPASEAPALQNQELKPKDSDELL